MSPTATPERLIPQLEAWLGGSRRARSVYAVLHDGEWTGGSPLEVAGRQVVVRSCQSELAIREALAAHEGDERPLVMLTPIADLGDDVVARLSGRRVAHLHAGDAVRHLFGDVRGLDSRLISERWLLEALVESAPPGGYERAGARQLDLDRAWTALLRHRYVIDAAAGLTGLITWATGGGGDQLATAPEVEQGAVQARLEATVAGAKPLLALVLVGQGSRTQGFGLVARALAYAPGDSGAMVRTQLLLGSKPGTGELRVLAERAEALTRAQLEQDDPAGNDALATGEQLLEELEAGDLAGHSALLPSGLRRRQAVLGQLLKDGRPMDEVEPAVSAVAEHARAAAYRAGHAAELALRLYRWLATDEHKPADIRSAALLHATDSAYADRARLGLRVGGVAPELEQALRGLVEAADERRAREESRFATFLGQWATNAETGETLLGVEDVLAQVAAPIVAAASDPVRAFGRHEPPGGWGAA